MGGVKGAEGDHEPENWGAGRGGGTGPWLGPGHMIPQNLGFSFLLLRMATLGVSFGLVACVLVLVLGLCFADEFLVSGEATDSVPGQASHMSEAPASCPYPGLGALPGEPCPPGPCPSCLEDTLRGSGAFSQGFYFLSGPPSGPQVAVAVHGPKGGSVFLSAQHMCTELWDGRRAPADSPWWSSPCKASGRLRLPAGGCAADVTPGLHRAVAQPGGCSRPSPRGWRHSPCCGCPWPS